MSFVSWALDVKLSSEPSLSKILPAAATCLVPPLFLLVNAHAAVLPGSKVGHKVHMLDDRVEYLLVSGRGRTRSEWALAYPKSVSGRGRTRDEWALAYPKSAVLLLSQSACLP